MDPLDALDWYGTWRFFDLLTDCSFFESGCDAAFGDAPEQRYMGALSDWEPVAEANGDGRPQLLAAPRPTGRFYFSRSLDMLSDLPCSFIGPADSRIAILPMAHQPFCLFQVQAERHGLENAGVYQGFRERSG